MTQDAAPVEAPAGGKGARTRQRLLEIAVRRFAQDGFRRTSVSAVAREARLTPAALSPQNCGTERKCSSAARKYHPETPAIAPAPA